MTMKTRYFIRDTVPLIFKRINARVAVSSAREEPGVSNTNTWKKDNMRGFSVQTFWTEG